MKIRTDFVTNSSSSSFITVRVDDIELAKSLGFSSTKEINDHIRNTIEKMFGDEEPIGSMGILDLDSLCALLAINNLDQEQPSLAEVLEDALQGHYEKDTFPYTNVVLFKDSSKEYYSKNFIKKNAPIDDMVNKSEGDIYGFSCETTEFNDGPIGPLLYMRINNGKRLTIVADELWDDLDCFEHYRGETIEGFEFVLLGKREDYSSYDAIIDYINNNGGTITEDLTKKTRYAIYPLTQGKYWQIEPAIDEKVLDKYRMECIPLVSEKAFKFRWLKDSPYEDGEFYDIANDFREDAVLDYGKDFAYLKWFEKFGYGRVFVEKWDNGSWEKS